MGKGLNWVKSVANFKKGIFPKKNGCKIVNANPPKKWKFSKREFGPLS